MKYSIKLAFLVLTTSDLRLIKWTIWHATKVKQSNWLWELYFELVLKIYDTLKVDPRAIRIHIMSFMSLLL